MTAAAPKISRPPCASEPVPASYPIPGPPIAPQSLQFWVGARKGPELTDDFGGGSIHASILIAQTMRFWRGSRCPLGRRIGARVRWRRSVLLRRGEEREGENRPWAQAPHRAGQEQMIEPALTGELHRSHARAVGDKQEKTF